VTTKVLGEGHCLVCTGGVQFKESKSGYATYYCHGCGCQFQGRNAGLFDMRVRQAITVKKDDEVVENVPTELLPKKEKQGVVAGWLSDV